MLASNLDQLVARGRVALVGKAAQLVQVTSLTSKLDQLVARGRVALVRKAPQLLEVTPFASSSMS